MAGKGKKKKKGSVKREIGKYAWKRAMERAEKKEKPRTVKGPYSSDTDYNG